MARAVEEERRKIRPDILTAALLDELNERILAVQTYLQELRPEGIMEPIEDVSVTDQPLELKAHFKPWFSIEFVNDGPDAVLVRINREKNLVPHRMEKKETFKLDMRRAVIEDIVLECETGKTATVRIVGSR